MWTTIAAALCCLSCCAGVAAAQDTPPSDAIVAARAAFVAALDAAPLSLPVAAFVTGKAAGFGMYAPRATSRFKAGDPLFVYVEPWAFKARRDGGEWSFGVSVDFAILSKAGDTLATREKFLDAAFRSHERNTELMLNATITVDNAPPGDYQLELIVHDTPSGQVARTRLPFTIE